MRNAALITCLWPGLPGLWLRGRLSELIAAAAFAALLNFALAASFVWPEVLGPAPAAIAWTLVALIWAVGLWRNLRRLSELRQPGEPQQLAQDLFPAAQTEYLKGNLYQAEVLLKQQLEQATTDADAGLMLATLYRRTNRLDEARRQLRQLQRTADAEKWNWEIERELEFLNHNEQPVDQQLQPEPPAVTGPLQQSAEAA